MKKKLLILTCIFAITNSFSQNSNTVCLKDSTYDYDENGSAIRRTIWNYNSDGKILDELKSNKENQQWVNKSQKTYTRNLNGDITTFEFKDWNSNSNRMENKSFTTNTYDATNKLIKKDSTIWSSGQYVSFYKNEISYTLGRLVSTDLISNWDASTQTWIGKKQTTHTYRALDSIRTQTLIQHFVPATNSWRNHEKQTFTFDQNAFERATSTVEKWDTINNIWKGDMKTVYTVSPNEEEKTTTYLSYNETEGVYKNESRNIEIYHPNSNLIFQFTQEFYDHTLREWHTSFYTLKTYTSSGKLYTDKRYSPVINQSFQLTYEQQNTYNQFDNLSSTQTFFPLQSSDPAESTSFTYDSLQNLIERKITSMNQGPAFIRNREIWEYNENNQITYYKRELGNQNSVFTHDASFRNFYTSCNILSTELVSKENVEIFPNPVANELNITIENSSEIQIFSIEGTLVHSEKLYTGNNTISTDNMKPGMYLIRFDNGLTSKFIKK